MSDNSLTDAIKWDRIHSTRDPAPPRAATVLIQNQHLLPAAGVALDLACGRGGNALLLAAHGLQTSAWDISGVALAALHKTAIDAGFQITTDCRDVSANPPAPASLDVVVVSHFLDRTLAPHLIAALRPVGLLFYQTFVRAVVDATGPSNPHYRLDPNELLELFRPLHILVYREEGTVGDVKQGWRNEAMLIGQKTA